MKHHQTYVNVLNAAEDAYFKPPSIRDQIALQVTLKFNGGGKLSPPFAFCVVVAAGHLNHTLFWNNVAPVNEGGGKLKDGRTQLLALAQLGGFKKQSNAATVLLGFRIVSSVSVHILCRC